MKTNIIMIGDFEYEIEPGSEIIGLITETQDNIQFIFKPGTRAYEFVNTSFSESIPNE